MNDTDPSSERWWEGRGAEAFHELDALAPPADLEARVLAACQAPLRRRRVLRRARGAALGAVLFLLGLWVGRGLDVAVTRAPAAPESPAEAGPEPDTETAPSGPEHIELLAELDPAAAAASPEQLRRAGDQYLNERHDLLGATRCYRWYLELLPADQRGEWRDEDSWLLASLRRTL